MKHDSNDENRWSSRHSTEHEVIISPKSLRPIKGAIHDFSFSGMFIVTDAKVPPVGTPVDVSVLLGSDKEEKNYHFTAVISRTEEGGAGLKLADYDDATIDTLQAIFSEK